MLQTREDRGGITDHHNNRCWHYVLIVQPIRTWLLSSVFSVSTQLGGPRVSSNSNSWPPLFSVAEHCPRVRPGWQLYLGHHNTNCMTGQPIRKECDCHIDQSEDRNNTKQHQLNYCHACLQHNRMDCLMIGYSDSCCSLIGQWVRSQTLCKHQSCSGVTIKTPNMFLNAAGLIIYCIQWNI